MAYFLYYNKICYNYYNLYNLHIIPVTTAEYWSPHAICIHWSFFIQNLLARLSANLLRPKVNTAPVSKRNLNALV